MRRKNRLLAGAVGAAVAITALSGAAFASSLPLESPSKPSVITAERCTSEEVTVAVGTDTAEFLLPAGCAGQNLSLHLAGADGTTRHDFIGAVQNVVSVSVPADPQSVLVTADTWALRTSGHFLDPEPTDSEPVTCTIPNGTCEVTITQFDAWPNIPDTYRLMAAISTDSETPQKWTVTFNLSSPELPFRARGLTPTGAAPLTKIAESGCGATPLTVTAQGATDWAETIGGSKPSQTIEVFGYLNQTGTLLSCP